MIFETSNIIEYNLSSLEVNIYKCNVSLINKIRRLSYQFFNSLNDEKYEIFWSKILRIIRRFEFNAQIYPLNSNHVLLISKDLLLDLKGYERIIQESYQSYFNSYMKLINIISEFIETENCTYENCFKNIIKDLVKNENYNIACILYRLSDIDTIAEYFQNDDEVGEIMQYVEFVSHASIKRELYDAVIVIGPTTIYPESIINSPRANKFYSMSYNWNKSHLTPIKYYTKSEYNEPLIDLKKYIYGEEEVLRLNEDVIEDLFDNIAIDINSIQNKISNNSTKTDYHVKARTVLLDNGKYLFLDESKKKYIVNSNLHISGDIEIDEILEHLYPKDMLNGMFLTYRDSSSGDYIEAYADHLIGSNASKCREMLLKWKIILRERAKTKETIEMAVEIIECGGNNTVKETNVRNWMSDEFIAPRNTENLRAILKYCDLADEADTLIKNALYIRRMHKKAGQQIRHELTKTLKNINYDELEKAGTLFIGSSTMRNLIISRISNVLDILTVPSRMLNKPFDLD
jgi:hypothetical protein